MNEVCKKKIGFLSALLLVCSLSNSAQAALVLEAEDFNSGTPGSWTLDNGAIIGPDAINGTLGLIVDTGGYRAEENRVFATSDTIDLRWMSSASISFDFSIFSTNTSTTRWINVEFFNGNEWEFIGKSSESVVSQVGVTFEATEGLGEFSQFRFKGKGPDGTRLVSIDNINISSVSAPATLALLGFGLVGLCFARRKKA